MILRSSHRRNLPQKISAFSRVKRRSDLSDTPLWLNLQTNLSDLFSNKHFFTSLTQDVTYFGRLKERESTVWEPLRKKYQTFLQHHGHLILQSEKFYRLARQVFMPFPRTSDVEAVAAVEQIYMHRLEPFSAAVAINFLDDFLHVFLHERLPDAACPSLRNLVKAHALNNKQPPGLIQWLGVVAGRLAAYGF